MKSKAYQATDVKDVGSGLGGLASRPTQRPRRRKTDLASTRHFRVS